MRYGKENSAMLEESNFMNIFVAVNEAYLTPLSVMLYSLQYHNPLLLKVYILHLGISKSVQEKFCNKMKKSTKRIKVIFLEVNANDINKNINYGRFGMETVLRLALLRVLPLDINKILWIDADVIIKGNIQKFYELADYGQYAVVCEDMLPKNEKHELFSKLGLKMSDKYFNAGIILFYLTNMRKDFKENDFFRWMNDNTDKLNYPDQNTLNICLRKKLCWVKPEIYNLQLLRVTSHMKNSGIINKSKILHYNTKEKPWVDNYSGVGEREFWKYGIRVLGIKCCLRHYIKKINLRYDI